MKEMSKNLDLDSVNILGVFKKGKKECVAKQYTDTIYGVVMGEKDANRCGVKHELYHIYRHRPFNFSKNKKENAYSKLKNSFVEEPQAIIYETLGIKL